MVPTIRHSVCALDCPDACSVLVHIDGEKAVRLQGNPAHPVTRGFLCAKVARYLEREYSPQRLMYPMRRVGAKGEGRFERISWPDALDEIAERLTAVSNEFGPEAVLPYSYAGNMGFLNGQSMDRRFFHRLGASQLDRTICSSAGGAGLVQALGVKYGTDPEDYIHSKLIIAWGANILGTSVHLWPFIVEARRRGAKFIVIDPVKTKTASLADLHLAINPGSDLALAMGLMHVIFAEGLHDSEYLYAHCENSAELQQHVSEYSPERVSQWTGLSIGEITSLARELATIQPAVIRLNYGVSRSERGGTAVRAIALLPALTGAWKHRGGGLTLSTSGAFQVDKVALEMPELQKSSVLGRDARVVNMSQLGSALTTLSDPPVKALVVYNSNPAAVAPDQNRVFAGLRRPDLFTVVLEQFQTDTADHADILLPVTTFLEQDDLYFSYGHYYIQMARAALRAPGETKCNVEIFRLLAQRMGFTEPCFRDTEDDMIRAALHSGHRFLEGITPERLEQERSIRLKVSPEGEPFLPFAAGGFGTPSGKCDLMPTGLDYVPPTESRWGEGKLTSRFPLELVSPKNRDSMNSTFGYQLELDQQTGRLSLHPADAQARGILSGDVVRVFNDRGSCCLQVAIEETVQPGVVAIPSTRWGKLASGRRNINSLTSERLTDIGGGATFYSCLVQVEKCESGSPVTV